MKRNRTTQRSVSAIRRGDTVQIVKGKDRGKSGKVLKVFPKRGAVLVEGAHVFSKSMKPRKEGEKGQVIKIARPMSSANVAVICGACGKRTRVRMALEGSAKLRACARCGARI
ncbi:MAG: 50S ribosomal protein L24 [Candidatus Colwellbacteria bacterium]|nr:50S ribosomal protein L24 [Candidatus Colwellbacteria bacterium]